MAEPNDTITPYQLSPEVRAAAAPARDDRGAAARAPRDRDELALRIDQPLASAVEQLERAMIHRAIREARGRVDTGARLLGLSRKGLFLKRRHLGIDAGAAS